MGLMGGAEESLEREAASSVGRRKGVPQRPALAMTMSMVEAVGPKAMAVLKAVRWEGQEVTSVWMKLMLGGVSGCSVSVYGQVYVRETLGFELCCVCFSELFVYIGNCHVGSIAGLAWMEVLV